jgi:hypothetical protein
MPTPDELRADLAAARREFEDAVRAAGDAWERKPSSGEGEDAWSPRQAAEHCIGADVAYATAVCVACGYPGLERWQGSYETPEAALEGFAQARALSEGRLKYVTDKDLLMKNERGYSVEQIMAASAQHFRDHAAQIRAAGQAS